MTAPVVGASIATAEETEVSTRSTRTARPPLERPENRTTQAGTSGVPVTLSPLQDAIEKLATPVAPSADAALAQAEPDEQRKSILEEALEVARVRQEFDISLREYNKAHGFTDRKSVV